MEFFLIVLIAILAIVLILLIYKQTRLIIISREYKQLKKGISREREAITDMLNLSASVISESKKEEEFLEKFVEYVLRSLHGTGAGVLLCDEDGFFNGVAVSGILPPIKRLSEQVAQQLMAHSEKHTQFFKSYKSNFTDFDIKEICQNKGYAFFENKRPIWFPENFEKEAPFVLFAPIKSGDRIEGLVIITSNNEFDSDSLKEDDGNYLQRLCEIAGLNLEVIRVFRERQEYDEQIQSAREEGMAQVSAGIIHNIGNAVTVAKLSVAELLNKFSVKEKDRPAYLIQNEILPKIKEKVENGKIQDFLANDKGGKQFLDIIGELLDHINNDQSASLKKLKSLENKLEHMIEIIELQQQFVGELGTENMTQLASLIRNSIKIFDESFNKREVDFSMDLDTKVPEILLDSTSITQVFMNIIKNAIEAIDSESDRKKKYKLSIQLRKKTIKEKNHAVVEITDNGPGIPDNVKDELFNFGFSTKKKKGKNSRGFGLHSCRETVRKYSGEITFETEIGKGTTFIISIPVKYSENARISEKS